MNKLTIATAILVVVGIGYGVYKWARGYGWGE